MSNDAGLQNEPITTVKRCNSREIEEITLKQALDYVQTSQDTRKKVDAIRSEPVKDKRNKLKTTTLPAYVFTGLFNHEVKKEAFKSSSGLFCIDIDHVTDVSLAKQTIVSIPYVVACFISPSGDGLKAVIHINKVSSDADIKALFPEVRELFKNKEIIIDESRKDISGLCFASYDPDIYINYEADLFNPDIKPLPAANTIIFPKSKDSDLGARCIDKIIRVLAVGKNKPGQRHSLRIKAARLAGGFIAGGILDEDLARAALFSTSDFIADGGITTDSEIKTLEDGINEGKKAPLFDLFVTVPFPTEHLSTSETVNEGHCLKPFPGVMELVVNETLRVANKPQPELSILSALIGMASSIGGNYKTPGGQRFNLYGIGISRTGTGKDKPMNSAIRLAKVAGTEIGGSPGSGAGLEDMLHEANTKILLNTDEVAHFIMAMNDVKQSHMATLGGYLLQLFSSSRGFYHTRRLSDASNNKQKECVNPCVSWLGFACPEKLGEAFGRSSNIEDGLVGRVLFVHGNDNVPPQRDHGDFSLPGIAIDRGRVMDTTAEITVGINYGADERLEELMTLFDTQSKQSNNTFEKALKTRSYEKCERIAGVLAIWDNPRNPIIVLEHVNWAAYFVECSDNAVVKFTLEHVHGGAVQADAKKILRIINKIMTGELKKRPEHDLIYAMGYLPRTALLHHSNLSKREFDEAINHLTDLDALTSMILRGENRQIKVVKLL